MSNIMMPPMSKAMAPANVSDAKNQIEPERETSFSNYMDKKIAKEHREKKALLGVKEKDAPRKDAAPGKPAKSDDTAEATLEKLMADLQNLLAADESKPGEWAFNLEGLGILDKLAQYAGMDDAELALLKKQMEEQGSLGLADLFAALEQHFSDLGTDLQVTVPETNAAFLESLLSKMGVSAEELAELSDKGVNGLSELDLIAYLQGLADLESESAEGIKLSNWDLEQLQRMLEQAGMSKESLRDLMPEADSLLGKGLESLGLAAGESDAQLSLERLKNLLEQAIADADAAKAKADAPAFLNELKGMLAQAGFEGKDVGWSPVVQSSMATIYQELQKMVDLSKVKIDTLNGIQAIDKELENEWLNSGKIVALEGADKLAGDGVELPLASTDQLPDEQSVPANLLPGDAKEANSFLSHLNSNSQTNAQEVTTAPEPQVTAEVRFSTPRVRLAPEMQQFTVNQISEGVMRGLRNNLHQLSLTMYPKELGEVKVDMQVRDNQVAVSFVMENSQVKEALESNMQDFKDSMKEQGFSMQECFVSVDQNNSDSARQRFEEAWERLVAQTGHERETGQPNDVMAMVGERHITLNQGGTISLFV